MSQQDDIRERALKCLRDKIKAVERGDDLRGPVLYGALIEAWMSASDDVRRETPAGARPPLPAATFDALAKRFEDVVQDLLTLLASHVNEVLDARRKSETEVWKSPPTTWEPPGPTTPWH